MHIHIIKKIKLKKGPYKPPKAITGAKEVSLGRRALIPASNVACISCFFLRIPNLSHKVNVTLIMTVHNKILAKKDIFLG